MAPNPYLNRSALRAIEDFYGRKRELDRLAARLGAQTPQSIAVFGERRVGKSSLLWYISRPEIQARYLNNPDDYIFVLLDCQGHLHLDREGFCQVWGRQLALAAGECLSGPIPVDFSTIDRSVQQLSEAGQRLVCLFDEFETITRNPSFDADFFSFLRYLANTYPLAFVTSSHRELHNLCHTQLIAESPFFNIFSPLHLGPLQAEEVVELICHPSNAAGMPLETHAKTIGALGGRLPLFVQIACSAVWESLEDGVSELDLDLLERRFIEEAEGHFQYLWSHFDGEERQLIGPLAVSGSPPSSTPVLTKLEGQGYLERRDGQLELFSCAFARFVRENGFEEVPVPAEAVFMQGPTAVPTRQLGSQVSPLVPGENPFPAIIGQSALLRQVFALIHKAAASNATVLINGETGTGKELVARTIHDHSERSGGPFIAVNCGSIAENLQESELFGHKKGAFTDAIADRQGLFEEADGGTLFLDEIGDTSLATQVKLLRALQEGEIRRVGENQSVQVDVRLICASNRNLESEITQGNFRQDLYYRLYVLVLLLPALRQRREDIPALIEHFTAEYEGGISATAIDRLGAYPWPGNVRELENQIISAIALAGGKPIDPSHLWPHLVENYLGVAPKQELEPDDRLTLKEGRDRFEREFIAARLQQHQGNINQAAQSLGLSRSRLYVLSRRYNLRTE